MGYYGEGGTGRRVGVTDTDIACADLVRENVPLATGAMFHQRATMCLAVLGTKKKTPDLDHRICFFTSGMIYYIVLYHNIIYYSII